MRKSKKEIAHKMFEAGKTYKEVARETGLKESTCYVYCKKYRKGELISINETVEIKNVENKETKKYCKQEKPIKEVIEVHNDLFQIGKDIHEIKFYLDSENGSMWFDFIHIMNVLVKEELINKDTFKTNIPDRYFMDGTMEGERLLLIDKMAIVELAKEVNDYTFLNASLNICIGEIDNVFYKFNQILCTIKSIDGLISDIDRKYEEVEAFNLAQLDTLHTYDNTSFLTDEQLLEISKRMLSIRTTRRDAKNEMVLSKTLRRLLAEQGMGVIALNNIKYKLDKLMDALYNKNYNPRVDKLEDWQKELIESI